MLPKKSNKCNVPKEQTVRFRRAEVHEKKIKNLLVFSIVSECVHTYEEQLFWCLDVDFHILFYTVLCHAVLGSSSVMLCLWLDCCIQTDCSEVSQLTTNSKIWAKVKNIKLENKHDNMFIFAKVNPQNVAGWGSTVWDQDIKVHFGTRALHVLHSFLDFCFAFFEKTFFGCKTSCTVFPGEYFWNAMRDTYHSWIFFCTQK